MRRIAWTKSWAGVIFLATMAWTLPGRAVNADSSGEPTATAIPLPTVTPLAPPPEKTFEFLNGFEDRLAGVVWLADGSTAADSLAGTPVGRLLAKVRLTGVVADITRWIGGLPLPAEAWKDILRGQVLFLWIHHPEYIQMALSSDEVSTDSARAMPHFAVVVEPPAERRRELMRLLATRGVLEARKRNPDLVATRKRVGGEILHVWERVARDGRRRCVLAYAARDERILLAGDERILMEILLRPREASELPPRPLQDAVRATLHEAASGQSPFAAVMDVRAFPLFRSRSWWSKGMGLERVGALMQSLEAEKSGTGAVLRKLHAGWDELAGHAPRGGPADLRRIEVIYHPDPELPRSRIRLVFEPRARVWAGQFHSTREFALVSLAPPDCVRYWAMRLPSAYFGETDDGKDGREGSEFGQFLVPTRLRIAAVWMVEAKSITKYVYDKTGMSSDWYTSRGVELVADPPNIGPWPKVRGVFRKIEPWLPLVGMPWRVRFVGDYVAFSRSIEALEKVSATGRFAAPSLGTAREDLFRRIDEHHRSTGGAPPVLIFERFTDFGRHAASIRAGDIFALPSADDTGGELLPFDVDWTTLLRVVPQVRGLLGRLPPHHTWVVWHPDQQTLEIETVSASGLPGDPAVWISTGFSLLPTFKKD